MGANVLDNITGSTPVIQWSEIKGQWAHLEQIPFEKLSRRHQGDLLVRSDHPVFHQVLREVTGSHHNDPIARLTNLSCVCFGLTLAQTCEDPAYIIPFELTVPLVLRHKKQIN